MPSHELSSPTSDNDFSQDEMELDSESFFDDDSDYDVDDENEIYDHRLGWCRTIKPPIVPPFTPNRAPGVHIDFEPFEFLSPVGIVEKFISPQLIKDMKKETNRYARQQRRGKSFAGTSLKSNWKPVTEDEVKQFFAIIIHMGILVKPKLSDYWSTDHFMHASFVSSIMSRDRFKLIMMYFHPNDVSTYISKGQPNHDPLHRVRPIFDELIKKFQDFFQPNKKIAIDEAMCAFRGRLHFRVYNPAKPDRYGMKMYELCDADSGFINKIEVYTGKLDQVSNNDQSITEQLVIRLMSKYLDQDYQVFMDNYYSSPI